MEGNLQLLIMWICLRSLLTFSFLLPAFWTPSSPVHNFFPSSFSPANIFYPRPTPPTPCPLVRFYLLTLNSLCCVFFMTCAMKVMTMTPLSCAETVPEAVTTNVNNPNKKLELVTVVWNSFVTTDHHVIHFAASSRNNSEISIFFFF